MSKGNELDLEAAAIRHATAEENAVHADRPSTRYAPRLSIDGNQWCALYGKNLVEGVAGFGASPAEAFTDFDAAWFRKLPATKGEPE